LITKTTRTKEKIEYGEKKKKWETRMKQVEEIINKLSDSSSQQLMAQVEVKK
jgi:hypothetical protein